MSRVAGHPITCECGVFGCKGVERQARQLVGSLHRVANDDRPFARLQELRSNRGWFAALALLEEKLRSKGGI